MVIHSSGKANHDDGLANIPHPPAEGGVPSYKDACVTRTYHQQYAVYKVPLYPQLLPSASATNNLAYFVGQTDPPGYSKFGLPSRGAVAVTVSGQGQSTLILKLILK